MVLRFARNGTVENVLLEQKKFSNWNTKLSDLRPIIQMAVDTASALAYIHSETPPVIHRDLACRNLLVDENYRVWLNDFGMSRSLLGQADKPAEDGKTVTALGPVKV
jgi:serine/threonine protein kinase